MLVPKPGHTATKTYSADLGSPTGFRKLSDYDLGWEFTAHEARLDDLDALAGLVAGLAGRDAILVRGELTEAGREARDTANRRINPKRKGDRPSLRACARRWFMGDVDRLPMPEGLSVLRWEDHAAIIDATIRASFPPAFWYARCFWQFSNSAGLSVTDTVKIHLFFWLNGPVDDDHLRRVLKAHMPDIDHAPFNPVQPHFVTDPRVVGGRDPLAGRRTGWREGAAEAVLPALPPTPPRPARKARDTHHLYEDGGLEVPRVSNLPSTSFLDDLQRSLGDGPGRKGFHEPLRRATLRYAAQVAGGHTQRSDEQLIGLLLRLVAAAPTQRCRHALGLAYDHAYMRRLLAGAYRIISMEQNT
ncbi:hypothetical protein [Belnapia arida]|uniref:hypothetical protein n=1 Tax=Belnapia arida TaxID=2804533 RepID=UPI001F18107A|nr:hypothetical protein [Belnapia arida]